MQPSPTVRSIQRRLFLLLLRAFIIAVGFLILFTLLVTGFVLIYSPQSAVFFKLPAVPRLEAYYIARGNWGGVSTVFNDTVDVEAAQWNSSTLLNAQNQIVILNGKPVDPAAPVTYRPASGDSVQPILVNGAVVGKLIVAQKVRPAGLLAFRLLQPVILASLILAIFATLIGLLLTRRVVSPLAEVIAAAEEIAGGRLQTRVHAAGPDDLRDLSNSFNKMADSLERNDRERRDMLADVAHELRTPLTVIRGRLEGIMDGVYSPDEDHIGPALEEAYLLERLVEDLRLLTLAESHQIVFDRHELDLIEIARRSLSMFQAEADEKKICLDLVTELDEALIVADPLRTEQVIGNLLSNALRYVPEGGHVWVEIVREGGEVTANINDDGPGIPEADLPFIFNRFWRGEKSRSRVSGGAGLGLAIAKFLVEGQGGRIAARSLPAGGLQVSVSMPAGTK
ncbi:MAG TPA: ATP-binding protein [Anaerolineales bacterium]|nr:ATP-binding protein [Anaerolineales bacterium]